MGNSIAVGDIVLYLDGADSEATQSHIISTKYSMGSPIVFYCSHTDDAKDSDWFYYVNNEVESYDWVVLIKIKD